MSKASERQENRAAKHKKHLIKRAKHGKPARGAARAKRRGD